MADEIDTFVLEYRVQSDKATRELQALQKNVEGINKTLQNSTQSVTRFVADLAGQLGTLSPAFSELSTVIRGIGSAAGVAGVAMVALSEGIRAASAAREQFNNQRQVSLSAGVGPARVNDLTRQFRAAGAGNVETKDVDQFLIKLQEMSRAAGADPSGHGPAVMRLNQLGLNAGMSTMEMVTALGGHWAGKSQDVITGEAGKDFNRDIALALGKVGTDIANPKTDFAAYADTANNVKELNTEVVKFDEHVNKLTTTMGGATTAVEAFLLRVLNKHIEDVNKALEGGVSADTEAGAIAPDVLAGVAKDIHAETDASRYEHRRKIEQDALVAAANKRLADDKNAQSYKQDDDIYRQQQEIQTQQELAINLFSQSVATFSNAVISKEQALAIWAGAAGSAGGLSKTGYKPTKPGESGATVSESPDAAAMTGGPTSNRNNPGNIRVTPWSKAHGAQGEMKSIATFATPEAGAQAMTDLLQSGIYKGKGINTVSGIITKWAPPSENNTAAYIKFVHDQTGLDVNTVLKPEDYPKLQQAMTRFEGGHSGPRAVAMDKHFKSPYTVQGGSAPVSTAGASAEGARLASVQGIVAERAHVNLQQLQQGRASRGDVEWAMTNQMTDYKRQEQQLKAQLQVPGLTDPIRQQLMRQQADTDVKITNLRDNWNTILQHTREGDRETTQNEYPVQINNTFNGYDSQKIWAEINARLQSQFGSMANARTTKLSH